MNAQVNKITGTVYQGMNQSELLEVKKKEKYKSNEWITFVQARELGKKLVNAKGKGVGLRRFSTQIEEEEEGKKYVNYFYVFNCDLLADIDGLHTIKNINGQSRVVAK